MKAERGCQDGLGGDGMGVELRIPAQERLTCEKPTSNLPLAVPRVQLRPPNTRG